MDDIVERLSETVPALRYMLDPAVTEALLVLKEHVGADGKYFGGDDLEYLLIMEAKFRLRIQADALRRYGSGAYTLGTGAPRQGVCWTRASGCLVPANGARARNPFRARPAPFSFSGAPSAFENEAV